MEKQQWQKKGAGHRGRLRDRFLERGLAGFSDGEVLELLLSFGTPRSDCKDQARQLLKKFGSFAKVLEAPPVSLQEIKGVGPKNSFALHFVHAVASYYLKERLQGKRYLHSSAEVVEYLVHSMRGLKKEVFTVIYLDSSHAIIDSEVIARGTLNVNTVYPREIVARALSFHAAALVVAHNHPSGSLQPSPQDLKLTRTLWLVCSYMQLRLLDHIIVGDGSYSFADNGLMQSISSDCMAAMESIGG
ncbi:MAG: DNA repair protein RadC [Deltaproteobacteria bacterium]|nr:DNA repair protein RadC [Deltaproteobacteria bacterium]